MQICNHQVTQINVSPQVDLRQSDPFGEEAFEPARLPPGRRQRGQQF